MNNDLGQFAEHLKKDDSLLNALLQDLRAYEEHVALLSENTQETLKNVYEIDVHTPIHTKEQLEDLLLKGW